MRSLESRLPRHESRDHRLGPEEGICESISELLLRVSQQIRHPVSTVPPLHKKWQADFPISMELGGGEEKAEAVCRDKVLICAVETLNRNIKLDIFLQEQKLINLGSCKSLH